MGIIQNIKDGIGNIIFPVTRTKAVYDDENNRLDNTLGEINSSLANLNSSLTGAKSDIQSLNSSLGIIRSHVGMIIQSTTLDTEDKVKAIYGGTSWTKIEGRFLLGASSNYTVNSTGGEDIHTLTINEIPSHTHWISKTNQLVKYNPSGNVGGSGTNNLIGYTDTETEITGGSEGHNNMPPYKAVYIWERIA